MVLNAKKNHKEEDLFEMCLCQDSIKMLLKNKKIIKKIYVKNKLINLVIQ